MAANGFRAGRFACEILKNRVQPRRDRPQIYTPTISPKRTGVITCHHQSICVFTRMITMPSQSNYTMTLKIVCEVIAGSR